MLIPAINRRGSQGLEVHEYIPNISLRELTLRKFSDELFEEKTSSNLTLQQAFPSFKWVFPSSQERYSTVFQEELDEWFDVYSLSDPTKREDLQREGLHDSVEFLGRIVDKEAKLVSADRVILLGLSQGCAIGGLPKPSSLRCWHAVADYRIMDRSPYSALMRTKNRGVHWPQRVDAIEDTNRTMPCTGGSNRNFQSNAGS